MEKTIAELKMLTKDELIVLYLEETGKRITLENQILRTKNLDNYNPKWSWTEKVQFALRGIGRPAKPGEMLSFLLKYEDRFDYYNDKEKTFSVHISNACKHGGILRHKRNGTKGAYYVLPEWINTNYFTDDKAH